MDDERRGDRSDRSDRSDRAEEQRLMELREREMARQQKITLKAMFFTLAIVIAPFLALVFGLTSALVVLAAGLGFTAWLTWSGARQVGPAQRSRLRVASGLNAVLCVVVLGLALLREL